MGIFDTIFIKYSPVDLYLFINSMKKSGEKNFILLINQDKVILQ